MAVLKEIQEREAYMEKIRVALKQDGRVAILEYRPEEPSPGPPKRYRLPETRVVHKDLTFGGDMRDIQVSFGKIRSARRLPRQSLPLRLLRQTGPADRLRNTRRHPGEASKPGPFWAYYDPLWIMGLGQEIAIKNSATSPKV